MTSSNFERKSLSIDVHTHVLPKSWPNGKDRYGYPGWISLRDFTEDGKKATMYLDDKKFRDINSNCWCCDAREVDMNNTSVDVQVLSTVPVMFSYWAKAKDALDLAVFVNDDIADRVKANPKKYIGLGTVPLQDPDLAIKVYMYMYVCTYTYCFFFIDNL